MRSQPNRRELIGAALTVGAGATLPAWASKAAFPPTPDASPALAAAFDGIFEAQLRRSPEFATTLGLDTGAHADLRGQLADVGDAGRAAAKAATIDAIARLEAIDPAGLADADRLNRAVVLYAQRAAQAVQAFDFGGSAYGPSPYVVSQNSGAYQSIPDFLDTKHPINDAADADAYVARLRAFARQLDQQTGRLRHDGSLGVIAPDFLLDLTLDQMTRTRVPTADQSLLVQSLARRAATKAMDGRYARDAATVVTDEVLPALDRQIALVRQLRARARHDAGMWQFRQGADFYAVALRNTTTTGLAPAKVHRFGLDQAQAISSRLDGLLRAQGMTRGTVGERIATLYKDPRQLYPSTDAGKAEAIAYCNDRLAAITARLPRAFDRLPRYRFEVRRVPPQTEAGAANAFAQPPTLDGSRPGYVYINLHDTADWPRLTLPTVIYHEGLPGHEYESGLALGNAGLPMIRKVSGFSGYGEGWALYAEQLADELGMYDDDPLGRIGYLKGQLFRAIRCVVDTGMHHLRWSREEAIRYLIDSTGEAPGFAAREVERYCASPGQACSYKLGHSAFVDLRTKAQARLGARYDIKAFHDAVLGSGRVPLDILRERGEAWIAMQIG